MKRKLATELMKTQMFGMQKALEQLVQVDEKMHQVRQEQKCLHGQLFSERVNWIIKG